jgi:dienelactone hydrolase
MAYEVEKTDVTIWSEGTRLAGELFRPVGAPTPGPAILFCHGWGGVKSHLIPRYAEAFARAGYICLFFDYRGWGESDGKLIAAAADGPPLTEAGERDLKVRVIRQVVDPFDELADIRACFAWLLTEEGVDPKRVGLWGSSYGGGLTTYITGTEPRVKALVAQIGSYGHSAKDDFRDGAYKQMTDKARRLIEPPIPQASGARGGGLGGVGDMARQYGYSPAKAAEGVRVPTLFIDAEFEEYYADEPQLQGGSVYETVRKTAVAERITYPCSHYKLYDEFLEPARERAIAWFDQHL